ncbi:hypothetical protein GCM10010910_29010 [Microbacterium nanhaiense]|uniref:HIT domain-containing protein n=1 Tax=Microbacterium nanhaiense TaxID=1301026 RepID=A0ABQ2N5U9_9MICO|nr:HIT family protein [Microbacterium nanhaiense]GGO67378.1 hypothetical protein GCM10010910_29010 [Microbacterium nanhaiense]
MSWPTHAPDSYECPFCRFQRGIFDEWNDPSDVVAVTEHVVARIAPKWWPDNPGGVLIIPRAHVENIYGLSTVIGHAVWDLTQRVAEAMRTSYRCEGTSIRQHNEPAGDQDVWHVHMHVLPRHAGDRLYLRHDEARWVDLEERKPYARRLREKLVRA